MGFVLTDAATFKCFQGSPGTKTSGVTISSVATNVTINGAHPILAGATIGGFTVALCAYQTSTAPPVPTPCVSFALTPPAQAKLLINGSAVYTSDDASTIALVNSTGNGFPGLQITESQQLVSV
jgi:hypothetical protein